MVSKEFMEMWIPWSAEMLRQDLEPSKIKKIKKFDGFCCVPDHLDYKEIIGNFYNLYHRLEASPEPGDPSVTLGFMRHIFGEQFELGLDYFSLLYQRPIQKLPVLCLISKERKTGKTTFLIFLKMIFGKNMTFNGNIDFRSQFNYDWMNTLIIAVDEVLLDRREDSEKIKNLSTARNSKVEAKGKDRKETEFFGKFVLCSNNEENFIVIDPAETRYWIRKVPVLTSENIHLLDLMAKELPAFLHYLLSRNFSVPIPLTKMWFSEKQIRTEALMRVVRNNRNRLETEMLFILREIFETVGINNLEFTNKDMLELLKRNMPRLTRQQVSNVLQNDWGLKPVANSLNYQTYLYNSCNELAAVHSTGRYYSVSVNWISQKFDEGH